MFQGLETLDSANPGNLGAVTGSFVSKPSGPSLLGDTTANGYGWSGDISYANPLPWHLYTKAQLGTNAAGLSSGMIGGWYFFDATQADLPVRRCYLPAAIYTNSQVAAAVQLDPSLNLQLFSTFNVPAHPPIVLQRDTWYWIALAWQQRPGDYDTYDYQAWVMPLGGVMTQLGPTFTCGGNNANYQSGFASVSGNFGIKARYGAASLYLIDTLADVAYPSDLLPPAAVRRDWYVNPATGSDANDGTTPATAWASVDKINIESAALGLMPSPGGYDTGDFLHLDCSAAPLVIGTAPLEIQTAGLTVLQTGGALDPQVTLGPAAWTPVTGHPNVYSTTDSGSSDLVAAVVREDGKYLNHPVGSTFADVSDALDATPGSFFCDDTTLYLHPFGDTDPRADAKTYRRTRNRGDAASGTNAALSAVIIEAPDVWYDGLNIAGTTLCGKTDDDPLGAYCFQWNSGSGGINLLSNFSCDHFSKHAVGATAGGSNNSYTRQDGVYGQATPYAGFGGSTADVAFSGDSTSAGNQWAFVRCVQTVNIGVIGSADGTADPGTLFFTSHASGVAFSQGQFLGCETPGSISEQGCTQSIYMRDTICGGAGMDCPLTAEQCQTTAGVFSTGNGSLILRNCLMKITDTPTDYQFASLGGSVDVAGCTIDLRGNGLGSYATTAIWSRAAGTDSRSIAIHNTALLMDSDKNFTLLLGFVQPGDTLDVDNNLYQLGDNGYLVEAAAAEVPLTFSQWQTEFGQDAQSSVVADAGLGADGRPGYGSPALDAGMALGPLTDLDDLVIFPSRRTIGAYELRTTYAMWQSAYPAAGPDDSGLPSLLEYAFGLVPGVSSAQALSASPEAVAGQTSVAMTYRALQNAADLSYVPEVSADLQTWSSGPGVVETIATSDLGGGVSAITVRALPAPVGSPDWRFLRLRVTEQ